MDNLLLFGVFSGLKNRFGVLILVVSLLFIELLYFSESDLSGEPIGGKTNDEKFNGKFGGGDLKAQDIRRCTELRIRIKFNKQIKRRRSKCSPNQMLMKIIFFGRSTSEV